MNRVLQQLHGRSWNLRLYALFQTILLPASLLIGLVIRANCQARLASLPIDESLAVNLVNNRYRCSPDGRLLAFAIHDSSRRSLFGGKYFTRTGAGDGLLAFDVWISDIKTGEARNLTEGQGTSWAPVWSPDGKSLAFVSDRDGKARLWVWDRPSGRMRRISEAIVLQHANLAEFRSWDVLQWTPDSRKVLTKVLPEGMTLKALEDYIVSSSPKPERPLVDGATVTVYRSVAGGNPDVKQETRPVANVRQRLQLGDLGLIDVATGQVQRIARRVQATRYDLSPDGSYIAYLNAHG